MKAKRLAAMMAKPKAKKNNRKMRRDLIAVAAFYIWLIAIILLAKFVVWAAK